MKKTKIITVLLSFLVVCSLVYLSLWKENNLILGIEVINEDKYESIIQNRRLSELQTNIFLKENPIPEVDGYYYLAQNVNDTYQGVLGVSSEYKVNVVKPEKSKTQLMNDNEPLKLIVYNNDSYDVKYIVLSGLPVIYLQGHTSEGTEIYGTITLFSGMDGGRTDIISVKKYNCEFHKRGGSSLHSLKPSYKVNLLSKNGNKQDASLLNMREDDDWILNPMFLDDSKMREKLSYDIWNSMSGASERKMEYCEIISNAGGNGNEYMGIYCLQEPVDLKTFSQSKNNSFTFSIKGWDRELTNTMLYESNVKEELLKNENVNVELTLDNFKAEQVDDVIEVWRWIKDINYQSETLDFEMDRDSLIKHNLFLNMVMAKDNRYKNQKFCAVKNRDKYTLYKTCWDLDQVMINLSTSYTDPDIKQIQQDNFYIKEVSRGTISESETVELYFKVREEFFNTEFINAKIDEYHTVLTNSGAFSREKEKWGTPPLEDSCEYLKRINSERIEYLDKYYGGNL